MKIRTNLTAGSMVAEAQDQAEKVFDSLNQTLSDASNKVEQYTAKLGKKLSSAWNCFITS